ncbi:MAG TPA: GAF domain-containing SpoIIE family protein phosphatase [Tepidisphaeraceae bacterium]|nr:GAF domain-containing SpoIIE family protein phosphatase [Tepidisphaeraceae bacterium]
MTSDNSISSAQMKQVLKLTRLLTVTADLDLLLTHIAETACALLDCERASIFLYDPKADQLWTKIALMSREIRVPSGAGIVGHVFKSNRTLHVPEPYKDARFNPEPDRRSGFVTRNLLTAPMLDVEGKPVGVIQAVNKKGGPFAPTEEAMIELLSDQAGVAIQRYNLQQAAIEAVSLRREMELAKDVQSALIPANPPEIPGIISGGYTHAASITGGDAYDLWKTEDGRLGIFLGDATGHGIGPALVVSQTRTLIRAMCRGNPDPAELLACANARLSEDLDAGKFVTAFCGFLSPDGTLQWCSAGHGPIFIRASGDEPMKSYDSSAPPLGIMPQFMPDPTEPVKLKKGGLICVTSDGIAESFAPDGSQFGNDRLESIICNGSCEPDRIIEQVKAAMLQWQGNDEPKDDQTMVIATPGEK